MSMVCAVLAAGAVLVGTRPWFAGPGGLGTLWSGGRPGPGALGSGGRPWLGALAAGAGLLAWRLRARSDAARWLRGADGEVATARLLAGLSRRFVTLHDRRVPGTRANLDHLVIGPTGIWVVDSKAHRARLRIHRGVVWAGEHEVATLPAGWEAERVAGLLGVSPVRAIVAVHGFGLRRRGLLVGLVRVVPARGLCRLLRRGERELRRAEVADLVTRADRLLPPAYARFR